MPDPRIIHVELDERTIIRRNEDIERERKVAIFDLLEIRPLDSRAGAGHG
jgi:uncharacterized protein (UPF0262 family)